MKNILNYLMNLFFPQECLFCRALVDIECDVCNTCEGKIKFLVKQYCISCGVLLPKDISLCGKCIVNPPLFTNLRSVFIYDINSKNVILNLKFHDDMSYIKTYAGWMYERNKDIFKNIDYIIPIPLHRRRLFFRKYNQSVLLSWQLSRLTNIPVQSFICKRIKNTLPQFNLSTIERKRNIKGSFAVLKSHLIQNRRILLVDDVVTTGATLKACTKILVDKGAKEVRALTLARTHC